MEVPTTFEQALDNVLSDVKDMLIAKRHDYGKGNIAKFGEMGVLVRSSDKVERLINLSKQSGVVAVKNETRIDTWMDLAGYSVIALLLQYGWFELDSQAENSVSP